MCIHVRWQREFRFVKNIHEGRKLVRKDTVVTETDLLVVLVIKFEAVEADVVRVSPGC